MKHSRKIGEITLIIIIGIIFIFGIVNIFNKYKRPLKVSSPVEDITIDSISKENDRLIIEVNNLDSIKNAKIIEVKSFDNDSTLNLFYKLIKE